ncbi:hypothetical protein AKG08_22460 [Achromobacter piechaudii]|nr:hypothetical protein AKG08_22460 [Achromobacter piechaudii]
MRRQCQQETSACLRIKRRSVRIAKNQNFDVVIAFALAAIILARQTLLLALPLILQRALHQALC